MRPDKLYRETVDGCTFETLMEAQNQSVDSAASQLLQLIIRDEGRCSKDGDELLELKSEIKQAIRVLGNALDGKLVDEYKINSL